MAEEETQPKVPETVVVGTSVTIIEITPDGRDVGNPEVWHITGFESDPATHVINEGTDLARALIGKGVGDIVPVTNWLAKILEISLTDQPQAVTA